VVFGVPFRTASEPPPASLAAPIEIPGLLSWLAFGDFNAPVKGLADFPRDERPPIWLTFVSFHNMVLLGVFFIALMAVAAWKLSTGELWQSRRLLKVMMWSTPLPVLACQLGWVSAEVGRQPWIVHPGLQSDGAVFAGLRTAVSHSPTVTAGEIGFSMALFGLVYLALGALWLFLMVRKAKLVPDPVKA